jgi:hypothetical protein
MDDEADHSHHSDPKKAHILKHLGKGGGGLVEGFGDAGEGKNKGCPKDQRQPTREE